MIPAANYNLGVASFTVNSALNAVNSVGNLALEAVGAVGAPLDRYSGEITSAATGIGPAGALVGMTAREVGLVSNLIRTETAINRASVLGNVPNNTTRVGRWMSEVEMNTMQSSGRVVESNLNGVTSVTSPPDAMKWMNQTDGSHFVEFEILTSALRASDGVTGKIFGPNSIFGPKLGITEMPEARNIVNTAIKIQR